MLWLRERKCDKWSNFERKLLLKKLVGISMICGREGETLEHFILHSLIAVIGGKVAIRKEGLAQIQNRRTRPSSLQNPVQRAWKQHGKENATKDEELTTETKLTN